VDGGAHFAPEGFLSLSVVAEACSSTALFFFLCLGMPMRTGSRGTARLGTAVQLCRRSSEFFLFPLFLSVMLDSGFFLGMS
jgi:hypothetical protein